MQEACLAEAQVDIGIDMYIYIDRAGPMVDGLLGRWLVGPGPRGPFIKKPIFNLFLNDFKVIFGLLTPPGILKSSPGSIKNVGETPPAQPQKGISTNLFFENRF